MKITATIESKIALAAGKSVAGKQEMDLDVALLTDAERALLGQVSASRPDGLEICHYQHIAHDMPALELESLRAYLARISAKQAAEAARKTECCQELRRRVLAGDLPNELSVGYGSGHSTSYDQWKELIAMEQTQALLAADAQAAADSAAARKAAADKDAADKAAAEAAARDEMLAWIAAHGSPRLRRCVAEGIECRAAYRDERLAVDRPGWRWYEAVRGEFDAPRNPPEDAFAQLDAARKTSPDAQLGWHTADEETDNETGDVTADAWQGYIAHAEFLGRTIILGGPQE